MFGWRKQSQSAVSLVNSRVEVFNVGLNLAMEWGEDWLQPIQRRLHQRFASLTDAELDEANAICQEAMRFGHSTVYELAEHSGKDTKYEQFVPIMTARFQWVNTDNLSRLFSQGMYYAWKDLGFA